MKSGIILISSILFLLCSCRPTLEAEFKYLHGEWDYVLESEIDSKQIPIGTQNWKSMMVPGLPPDWKFEKFLLIRRGLPNYNEFRDPVLYLEIALENFEVFIDGKSIYKFGDFVDESQKINGYLYPHLISLPQESNNSELRIYFNSNYHGYIGIDRNIYIGERSTIVEKILLKDYSRYVLGFFYLFISLFSITYYFVTSQRIYLYYGLLSLVNSFLTLIADYVGMNFFENKNYPHLIYIACIYLIPLFFFIFIKELYKKEINNKWLYNFFIFLYIFFLIYEIFIKLISPIQSFYLESYFYIFLIVGFFFLYFIISKSAYKGDKDSKLLFMGISIYFFLAVHDVMQDQNFFEYHFELYWYGNFFFIIIQGTVLLRRLYFIQKKFELKETELSLAKKIQFSILPSLPNNIPNWELVSIYEPMREVGGDFYDITIDKEGNIGLLILDVSGQGVGSALIASMAKAAFFKNESNIQNPEVVLSEMNKSLFGKLNGNFVTAFFLTLNPNKGIIQFSSAGHPSGIFISPVNNEIREFRTKSKPIGLFEKISYNKSYLYLSEGDLVCLYTDGVIELTNHEDECYGEIRLAEFLLANSLLPLEHLKSKLIEDLINFSRYNRMNLVDDLTLILLRYTGS